MDLKHVNKRDFSVFIIFVLPLFRCRNGGRFREQAHRLGEPPGSTLTWTGRQRALASGSTKVRVIKPKPNLILSLMLTVTTYSMFVCARLCVAGITKPFPYWSACLSGFFFTCLYTCLSAILYTSLFVSLFVLVCMCLSISVCRSGWLCGWVVVALCVDPWLEGHKFKSQHC